MVKRRTSAVQKRTLDFSNALLYNQYRSKSDTKSDLPSVKNDYERNKHPKLWTVGDAYFLLSK